VEELGEVWTRWLRRSVVSTMVPERSGEGRVDSAILGCFDIEEERGIDVEEERGTRGGCGGGCTVEVDVEDTEEEWAPVGV
jgi:hypothetical protein